MYFSVSNFLSYGRPENNYFNPVALFWYTSKQDIY